MVPHVESNENPGEVFVESSEPAVAPAPPIADGVLPTPEVPAIPPAPEDPLPASLPTFDAPDLSELPAESQEQPLPLVDAQSETTEEEPIAAPNDTPLDDIPLDEAPADEPVAETSLDDLFAPAEPAEPTESAETPEQEAEPAEEQQAEPPQEAKEESPQEEPAEESNEETTKEEKEEDEELSFEDIFGSHTRPATLREPGGLDSKLLRTWSDNTGRFGCQARLLRVTTKAVVLLRSAGENNTVALSRLSDEDLRFVRRQVVAHRQQLAARQVVEKLAVAWGD